MQTTKEVSFMSYFEGITDPREEGRKKQYPFGEEKIEFLRKIFPYEYYPLRETRLDFMKKPKNYLQVQTRMRGL